ncbi:twin-arginine translocase subunit TatC [Oceanobacillus halophilus]|uniref:Sec-independent protein translocase protein TatC n=1 Tax=Oceanobacillus halophilus TaxID=930130 RepID=A0A494ZV29_9BACI|nr:twin-arginine translocase subunit TatC [Oceanobacillus halophilus]RKQ30266.1 twin-arginine translocase subunit TatC [Oceanobacillus halophilus]
MEQEMSLVEHLTELRKRLIVVAAFFMVTMIAGFIVAPPMLTLISEYTLPNTVTWNVFSFTDGFMIYIKCALLVSILFTLPVFLYEVWAFIKPGLTEQEAKGTIFYIPLSFFLFILGVSFSFLVLFPIVLEFMGSINQSIGVIETYGISQYFTFLFNIVFPVSIVFEMPVVVLFLSKLGIIDPRKLKKVRKYAYFILVVVGVSITPPDLVSDLLIIFPLFLLFEISILLSGWSIKRQRRGV